jgi:hypothetical protein
MLIEETVDLATNQAFRFLGFLRAFIRFSAKKIKEVSVSVG